MGGVREVHWIREGSLNGITKAKLAINETEVFQVLVKLLADLSWCR